MRTTSVLAVGAVVVACISCGPPAPLSPDARGGVRTVVVNAVGDDPLTSGETACDSDPRTPGLQCTFRAAVEAANRLDHAVILLPAGRFVRTLDRPLVISRAMTISGDRNHASVIDARQLGPVFEVHHTRLRLRNLTLTNGRRASSAAPTPSRGIVAMTNVTVADTASGIQRARHGSWVRSCVLLRNERADFLRRAVFSDPTALGSLAGAPF